MSHSSEATIQFETEEAFLAHAKKLAMLKPGDVFYAPGEDGKPVAIVFVGWEDHCTSAKGWYWDKDADNREICAASIGIGIIFFSKEECASVTLSKQ